MRLSDAARLGHANLSAQKGRNVATIVVISVLFGLVMGVNFLLQGLSNILTDYAGRTVGGEVYVDSYLSSSRGGEIVRQRIEKYHGRVLGVVTTEEIIGRDVVYYTTPEVMADFISTPIEETPEGWLPTIISREDLEYLRAGENGFGGVYTFPAENYFAVGEGYNAAQVWEYEESPSVPLLDLVLWDVAPSQSYGVLIIDDGSGELQEIIKATQDAEDQKRAEEWEMFGDGEPYEVLEKDKNEHILAVFPNVKLAYDYMQLEDEAEFNYSRMQYTTMEVYSAQTSAYGAVKRAEQTLRFFEIVLLVVAAVVLVFTFVHLIDHEVQTIALYRALGATTGNIVMIYLIYLLELCVLAIIFATLVGTVMAFAINLFDAQALAIWIEHEYELEIDTALILWGLNWHYLQIVLLMLMLVPVTFILTFDRMSPNNIARRLKQD